MPVAPDVPVVPVTPIVAVVNTTKETVTANQTSPDVGSKDNKGGAVFSLF